MPGRTKANCDAAANAEILSAREADAKRAFSRPSSCAVTRNLNALGARDVPIERRLSGVRLKVSVEKICGFVVAVCTGTHVLSPGGRRRIRMALPDKELGILSCQRVISISVSDDPVPRALRIIEAPGLDQELQPGFCCATILRKAKPQDIFDATDNSDVFAEDD